MSNQTLWEIGQDMLALDQIMAECGGDMDDPKVAQAIAEMNDQIINDLEVKADNYAAYVHHLLARAKARAEEAERLSARAKVDTNAAKRLRENMKTVLEFAGVKKIETPRFQISIAGNGGKQPIECNVKPDDLPDELRKTEFKINSDAIRTKLEAGEEVPGCRLLERGTSLRIR